jgi:hypothetical protein
MQEVSQYLTSNYITILQSNNNKEDADHQAKQQAALPQTTLDQISIDPWTD